jgi:deazaflavin-dependent oxidoreductase (nitroreductase family)
MMCPMRSNPLRTMFQSFGRRQWFSTTFRGIAPSIDRFLLRVSKGRLALLTAAGLPTLLLTTTGRKSGEQRTVPLLFTVHDGAFIVIGSNWGQAHQPAWVLNLLAEPAATVKFKDEATKVRARQVEGDEREQMFRQLLRQWPGYENYVERAGEREIRIFALESA